METRFNKLRSDIYYFNKYKNNHPINRIIDYESRRKNKGKSKRATKDLRPCRVYYSVGNVGQKTFGYEKDAALAMCRSKNDRFVVNFIYKDLI